MKIRIRDKHPGSATLRVNLTGTFVTLSERLVASGYGFSGRLSGGGGAWRFSLRGCTSAPDSEFCPSLPPSKSNRVGRGTNPTHKKLHHAQKKNIQISQPYEQCDFLYTISQLTINEDFGAAANFSEGELCRNSPLIRYVHLGQWELHNTTAGGARQSRRGSVSPSPL